jgi:hypothetical protein
LSRHSGRAVQTFRRNSTYCATIAGVFELPPPAMKFSPAEHQ